MTAKGLKVDIKNQSDMKRRMELNAIQASMPPSVEGPSSTDFNNSIPTTARNYMPFSSQEMSDRMQFEIEQGSSDLFEEHMMAKGIRKRVKPADAFLRSQETP